MEWGPWPPAQPAQPEWRPNQVLATALACPALSQRAPRGALSHLYLRRQGSWRTSGLAALLPLLLVLRLYQRVGPSAAELDLPLRHQQLPQPRRRLHLLPSAYPATMDPLSWSPSLPFLSRDGPRWQSPYLSKIWLNSDYGYRNLPVRGGGAVRTIHEVYCNV